MLDVIIGTIIIGIGFFVVIPYLFAVMVSGSFNPKDWF